INAFLLLILFYLFLTSLPSPLSHPLSLHDALPISVAFSNSFWAISEAPSFLLVQSAEVSLPARKSSPSFSTLEIVTTPSVTRSRSEEHTSELQSRFDLVCRLLLEKKNKKQTNNKTE